ncbi:MAG TPA: hypothetical protein VHX12_13850, partial [Acidisoma sp.]|nr:hypothetical protein [Acidisoma sp.]
FWCGGGLWRCTDIGTRVIIAIRLDRVDVGSPSPELRRTLGRAEAKAEGWFNGPPYAVSESVFDEYDMEGCSLEPAAETAEPSADTSSFDGLVIEVSPENFDAFVSQLAELPQPNEKLRRLLQRRPTWKEKT